jgi:hypothetical protein
MRFAIVLAALAGLATAVPGKPLKNVSGLTKRGHRHKPSFNRRNHTHPEYSGNWAGAVQSGKGFNHVEGTIIVPHVKGKRGAAASAWVGIDGDDCQRALLQTGISFYADGSFDAWYEWIPDASSDFQNFELSVGDQIRMTIDATSSTSGVATLENLTTRTTVSHTYKTSPSKLCQNSAEWIVEAFMEGQTEVVLANFGQVTFTDICATDATGSLDGDGATIIDMQHLRHHVLTDCYAAGSNVSCTYTGH